MGVIRLIIFILVMAVIVDGAMNFYPDSQNIDWVRKLKSKVDLFLHPLRKYLPPNTPFDFSYIVFIFIVQLILFLW